MGEGDPKKPGNGEGGEGSAKFNLDLPDLFYDIICNFFPGAIAIALYLPRLVVNIYNSVGVSHHAIGSILLIIAAWIIGVTLNVGTAAFTFYILVIFKWPWKRGKTFTLNGEAAKLDERWILKHQPDYERRLLTKLQAQKGFFRVMFFISFVVLICPPSDYYSSMFFKASRLTKLYEEHYYLSGLVATAIFLGCWHIAFHIDIGT